jgi:NitT/TauT family transport system ATP-binding protein
MLLDLVGLADVGQRYPHELSGGMQQRAALARALVHDPAVLFMDEPFGALDALTREELVLELQRLHMYAQKTVVFVTHSISEAVFLSDRVLVLSRRPTRIVEEIKVNLPRPRLPEHETGEEFRELELRIRLLLMGRQGRLAAVPG